MSKGTAVLLLLCMFGVAAIFIANGITSESQSDQQLYGSYATGLEAVADKEQRLLDQERQQYVIECGASPGSASCQNFARDIQDHEHMIQVYRDKINRLRSGGSQ